MFGNRLSVSVPLYFINILKNFSSPILIGAAILVGGSIFSPVGAVSIDLATSDGGFTATTNGNGSNWAAGQGWNMTGEPVAISNSLTSPVFTVQSNSPVSISFNHRHNFEFGKDGGQLLYSLNGGVFTLVTAFTANGYTGTLSTGNGNPIEEQNAWSGQSSGYLTPAFITSTADLGTFNANDQIQIQFRAGWDNSDYNSVPNWQITSTSVSNTQLVSAEAVPFDFNPLPGIVLFGIIYKAKQFCKQKKLKQNACINFNAQK